MQTTFPETEQVAVLRFWVPICISLYDSEGGTPTIAGTEAEGPALPHSLPKSLVSFLGSALCLQ